jgi:hypothetical protein
MTTRAMAVSIGVLLALPGLAAAQGLGDAAAREAQKRTKAPAKKEQPAKSLTNEDLDKVHPPGGYGTPSESAPSEAGTTQDVAPSTGVDRAGELRSYVDAVQGAQARVEGLEAQIRDLGTRLNPMSTSFIYGANAGTGGNLQAEEMRVRSALTQAEGELTEARKALAEANQNLEDARQGRTPSQPPD